MSWGCQKTISILVLVQIQYNISVSTKIDLIVEHKVNYEVHKKSMLG